ncbi:MAG: hypothetical protein QNJ53_07900 [Pleurocapsa sp. MO_192.B19]|nr:hypothetical protein [Pleurocapsa sp. MO_192.B19]
MTHSDRRELDPEWQHSFDLVYECRNIQALPLNVRSQVIKAIAPLVSKSGQLLIITRHRDNNIVPEGPPWALSDTELSQFTEEGLKEIRRDSFLEGEKEKIEQLRVEYNRKS